MFPGPGVYMEVPQFYIEDDPLRSQFTTSTTVYAGAEIWQATASPIIQIASYPSATASRSGGRTSNATVNGYCRGSSRTFTFMGNVELDLTTARIGAGTSEIEIRCIMANVEITVPSDIRVISDGEGMLGSFEIIRVGEIPPLPPDAPHFASPVRPTLETSP